MKKKTEKIDVVSTTRISEIERLEELAAQANVIAAICNLGYMEQIHRGEVTSATKRDAIKAINKAVKLLKDL